MDNSWNGGERRKDYERLGVIEERVNNIIETNDNDRAEKLEFRRGVKDSLSLILKHIDDIDKRCLLEMGEHKEFNQHLEEHRKNKQFYKDQRFKIYIIFIGLVLGSLWGYFAFLLHWVERPHG